MIKTKNDLKYFLSKDLNNLMVKNSIKAFFFNPIVRFTILLRLNEYLHNSRKPLIVKLLPLLWYRRLGIRLGFSIPLNVFDSGLAIVHYGLIVVNSEARVGKNCRIHAGVNIGGSAGFKKYEDKKSYSPIVGDNCYIGPGAKLFGPIEIKENCVIGANAVVNKSFLESEITIGGIPARKISNKSSKGLIFYDE